MCEVCKEGDTYRATCIDESGNSCRKGHRLCAFCVSWLHDIHTKRNAKRGRDIVFVHCPKDVSEAENILLALKGGKHADISPAVIEKLSDLGINVVRNESSP